MSVGPRILCRCAALIKPVASKPNLDEKGMSAHPAAPAQCVISPASSPNPDHPLHDFPRPVLAPAEREECDKEARKAPHGEDHQSPELCQHAPQREDEQVVGQRGEGKSREQDDSAAGW